MKKQNVSVRYPAVPLIVHDPYFSIWSASDKLNESWATHWTGSGCGLGGFLRVDGKPYRFSGCDYAPEIKQTGCTVYPTRTVYTFENSKVKFTLTFLTPALPHRLDVLSRPITYLLFDVESVDGKAHKCEVYFDCAGESCVDQLAEEVTWSRYRHPSFDLMSMASARQLPLSRSGDNLRIDWGRLYLGIPHEFKARTGIANNRILRNSFCKDGSLPEMDSLDMPQKARKFIALSFAMDLDVPAGGTDSKWAVIGYDDVWSLEYLDRKVPAYWRAHVRGFNELLTLALKEMPKLKAECEKYDAALLADAKKVGGEQFAVLAALSFRQAIAAHKLVADEDGTPLFFSKENFSNGCICTVDVTYPSAPLFLLTNPALLKGMLIPILDYAGSRRWKFPFAPHDLGTYPLANGQVYGGGEETEDNQMPVEECGNMLILAGAMLKMAGDEAFVKKYLPTLRTWAEYLLDKGYDPENQLCTDDFAGHLAHNTNLSLKAILGLGAQSLIEAHLGNAKEAKKFRSAAEKAAKQWKKDAFDGDHYRLAFDRPGSWSQKYNLVWDKLLDLNFFPADIAKTELAYYRKKQNGYGLPLDDRRDYTKLDWIVWSATLTGSKEDFNALIEPLYKWINETPSRVPLTDWYETKDGRQVGFQARSVVGGVFIPFLYDKKLLEKYGKR